MPHTELLHRPVITKHVYREKIDLMSNLLLQAFYRLFNLFWVKHSFLRCIANRFEITNGCTNVRKGLERQIEGQESEQGGELYKRPKD